MGSFETLKDSRVNARTINFNFNTLQITEIYPINKRWRAYQGHDMVHFFARDPIFWLKILIPMIDPKSSLIF